MKLLKIMNSPITTKKWRAVFKTDQGKEKTTDFGSSGMRDFTLINNKTSKFYLPKIIDRNVVKDSYLRRHKKDLLTKDPTRAGFLSYYVLWNKRTMKSSIADYKKRFSL
jgi:hypothetical protein